VIEAAEVSAAGIREAASAEAREHVARVAEAADGLRERIDALDRELSGMIGALRSGADRVRAELDDLAAGTSRLAAASAGAGAREAAGKMPPSALGTTVAQAAAGGAVEEVGEEPALAAVEEAPGSTPRAGAATPQAATATPDAAPEAVPAAREAGPAAPVGRSTDVAGARIVALQWVMDGRPREETDRHLAEHFDLPDRAALLDQVYAIVSKA
jgi:hypothetical protein